MVGATWNLSGGSFTNKGQWGPNGAAAVFNLSGGTLTSLISTINGPLNLSLVTVSGTSVVDLSAFFGTASGTIDFLTGWTGSFTVNNYTAALWETLFTTGNATGNLLKGELDGSTINAATFNSNFQVTNGGTTLSFIPSIPPISPATAPEPMSLILVLTGVVGLVARGRRRRNRD